ncbi:hypothetical protein K438DRAFT_1755650 [Mycena galopus ATCC 62051]|nr:hypothetical protein K438DRAFT_1755650 [Mycena galopus ATCC 62051]
MATSIPSLGGLDYPTFAWDHYVYRCMFLSGFAILIFDHMLTFGDEVELIWRKPLRLSACWFFAVRYLFLACSGAMVVFYFADLDPETYVFVGSFTSANGIYFSQSFSCSKMERVMEVLLMVQTTLVETTLCLRVIGMYANAAWVKVSFGIFGAITAGLGLWTIIKFWEPEMLFAPGMSLIGCHTALPRSTLIMDLWVFGLTVYRARADRAVISMVPGSLVETMMLDGAMYFGVIVLANLADVLTIYIIISGILTWWTTSLSVTLITRLILNLHRAGGGNSVGAFGSMTQDTYGTQLADLHFVDQGQPARPVDSLFENLP